MKISIITVVFNDLQGIKKTVQSVISQKDKNFEYIIIDGNSTDGTKEYINQVDIANKKISEPDEGIYNAMNKAVEMAEGEFCIFMNAGDRFYDDEVILKANKEIGDADLYVGNTVEVGKGKPQFFQSPKKMTIEYLFQRSIYHQSTFIRTALLKEHPYDERYKIVSDWAFFFERWLNGAEYKSLDFYVSYYYLGGYSQQHVEKISVERQDFICKLFPTRVYDCITSLSQEKTNESKIERKIRIAMTKAPICRDIALIRYGGKYLFKDILHRKKIKKEDIINVSSLEKKKSSFKISTSSPKIRIVSHKTNESSYKINVLYDSQAFDMQTHGGVSRCFAELYSHMPEYVNAHISVVETNNVYLNNLGYPYEGKTYDDFIGGKNTPFKRFLYKLKYNYRYGHYKDWDKYPKLNQYETIKCLTENKFDIFHPTFFSPYFFPYLKGKPFVLTVHDMITELYPQYYPPTEPQLNNKKLLIPQADHIIAVSQNTKRDIIRFFNIPEDKISIVYHGTDITPYIPTPYSNLYGEYILYVGERHWYKNFKLFLRNIIPILKRHKDLNVICTGKPFSQEESMLIEFFSMKDRFIQVYVENNQEFMDLYHNAIAFVYPSEYEGFGIPILEAYKADCPVMLNQASCFPEIAGDAAIYFTMTEEQSTFEEQFENLYHMNSNERENLLKKQRERLSLYSWEDSARQLAKIYSKIC